MDTAGHGAKNQVQWDCVTTPLFAGGVILVRYVRGRWGRFAIANAATTCKGCVRPCAGRAALLPILHRGSCRWRIGRAAYMLFFVGPEFDARKWADSCCAG